MTIKLALAAAAAVLPLGACDPACRPATRVRPIEAVMPVAVACVPKGAPISPRFPDDPKALLAAPDMAARDRLLREAYPQRLEWDRLASRLLADCAAPGAVSKP